MAKKSAVQKNLKRIKMVNKFEEKRKKLKKIIMNKKLELSERFAAQLKLDKLPKNSSPNRLRNRCSVTGRPRGYMRYFGLSRITFRKLALEGELPGVRKGSL